MPRAKTNSNSPFVKLRWPLGGVTTRAGFESGPVFTTPYASNVWPTDEGTAALGTGRERGGSRPGLAKAYSTQLGSGAPIRLLTDISYAPAKYTTGTITIVSGVVTLAGGTWPIWAATATLTDTTHSVSYTIASRMSGAVVVLTDLTVNVGAGASISLDPGGVIVQAFASSAGKLYYDNRAGGWTEIANYGGLTLASDQPLTACDFLSKLYIAGDNTTSRVLLQYIPTTDTLSAVVASAGSVPTKCTLVLRWRNRIVCAGDAANPHLWYMSAIGSATDWDTGATGPGAAVSAETAPYGGQIGEAVRSLIEHSDMCMIFGGPTSMTIMRGDPVSGGQLMPLSVAIGIVGPLAYCYDPEGYLWFVSQDGLYLMGPGCGSTPFSVSRDKIPNDLLNLDPATYVVSMDYDLRFRGMHLSVTGLSNGLTKHYFLKTKNSMMQSQADIAFWPVSYPNANFNPYYSLAKRSYVPPSYTTTAIIFGCKDGYVRTYDSSVHRDDGTSFNSRCDLGPFALSPDGYEGQLTELQFVNGLQSGPVTVQVATGRSFEECVQSPYLTYSQTFTAKGVNPTIHPRSVGSAAKVILTNGATNDEWEMEECLIKRQAAGRRRP